MTTASAIRIRGAVGLLAAAASCAAIAADAPPQYVWEDVPRVVALGDLHGAYDEAVRLLHAGGLIDAGNVWAGGDTHLVFVGDLLDRGPGERPLLDLVRHLQVQAPEAGGGVHVVLGNHEIMNLVRDMRYVAPDGCAAFTDFEYPADRHRAYKAYRHTHGGGRKKSAIQAAFDEAHPPGYFGRIRAFGPVGPYAEWLLDQPVIIKINQTAFVHGGLTEDWALLGIDTINRVTRESIIDFWGNRAILEDAHEIGPDTSFRDVQLAAAAILARSESRMRIQDAARGIREFMDSPAFARDGPVWYRGNALEDERIERSRITEVLYELDARRMVLGHTTTKSHEITSRFDGTVFRSDVGVVRGHDPQALVLVGDDAREFSLSRGELGPVRPEFPSGEGWGEEFGDLTDPVLERFLEAATIELVRPLGRGSTRPQLLVLAQGAAKRRAVYKNVEFRPDSRSDDGDAGADRFQHEIAAYHVDRMIGLGMVPVTVQRRLPSLGRGSVQVFVAGAVDGYALKKIEWPSAFLVEFECEFRRVRAFDLLIGNADRKETDILYVPDDDRFAIIDHSQAFTADSDLDRLLGADVACWLDPDMAAAIRGLDGKALEQRIGPWIDKARIRALLARRDKMLSDCRIKDPEEARSAAAP